jgi:hypothetical protein
LSPLIKNTKTKISFTRLRSIECWCYNTLNGLKVDWTLFFTKQ